MWLIDADNLNSVLDILMDKGDDTQMWEQLKSVVASCPTIEPERKKGKWIPVDSFSAFGGDEITWEAHGNPIAFYYCSECKEQAYANENGESILSRFCPNCGYQMERNKNG